MCRAVCDTSRLIRSTMPIWIESGYTAGLRTFSSTLGSCRPNAWPRKRYAALNACLLGGGSFDSRKRGQAESITVLREGIKALLKVSPEVGPRMGG